MKKFYTDEVVVLSDGSLGIVMWASSLRNNCYAVQVTAHEIEYFHHSEMERLGAL